MARGRLIGHVRLGRVECSDSEYDQNDRMGSNLVVGFRFLGVKMTKIQNILFLLGCNEGQSKRYRVFNSLEYLRKAGIRAEWAWDIHSYIQDPDYLAQFDSIVVFRSGWNDRIESFFKIANELNIPLIYDIDDLVFDPSIVDLIDVYNRMEPQQKEQYVDGIESVYKAISACDYITGSTSYLTSYLHSTFRKPAYVVPFGVNDEQIKIASEVAPWSSQVKFLGYLSGTATHHADFQQAAAAIERILLENDDVFLKVIGPLDVEALLPQALHKVIRLGFMDWRDLVIETASLYINLAPFDHVTPFCKSKSQLKYIEAAMCKVPTVASPVPSYVEGIESGVNGFIADTESEWYDALNNLVRSPGLRNEMGLEAHLRVCRNHYPTRIGQVLQDVYGEIRLLHSGAEPKRDHYPVMPARKDGLRISWIIPQPFEASGGHRNIFRAIKYLSEFGHSVSVYILPDNHRFANGAEIDTFIATEFFPLNAEQVILGVDNIEKCDVLVSTYWTTAYEAKRHSDKTSAQIYFLQDFEPMFFPMGTDYVRAMESYKFGFRFVCSGPWPLRMLEHTLGITNGDFFRFPVDREIYYPSLVRRRTGHRRVAFFARPDMPRRCYHLGMWALEIVKKTHPEVEVIFYGDHASKYNNVPFEFTALGMTKTIKELGNLYRSVDVGLCFSTTNPSLVPFEMMACGCPVVDLDVNGNEVNYGSSENACLVAPSPEKIAEGIIRILDDGEYSGRISRNGIEYARIFPSEVDMVRLIESYFVEEYNRSKARQLERIAEASAPKRLPA